MRKFAPKLGIGLLPYIVHRAVGKLGIDFAQQSGDALFLCACQLLHKAEVDHAGFVRTCHLCGNIHAVFAFKSAAASCALAGSVAVHAVVHNNSCGSTHVAVDTVKRDNGEHFF